MEVDAVNKTSAGIPVGPVGSADIDEGEFKTGGSGWKGRARPQPPASYPADSRNVRLSMSSNLDTCRGQTALWTVGLMIAELKS